MHEAAKRTGKRHDMAGRALPSLKPNWACMMKQAGASTELGGAALPPGLPAGRGPAGGSLVALARGGGRMNMPFSAASHRSSSPKVSSSLSLSAPEKMMTVVLGSSHSCFTQVYTVGFTLVHACPAEVSVSARAVDVHDSSRT